MSCLRLLTTLLTTLGAVLALAAGCSQGSVPRVGGGPSSGGAASPAGSTAASAGLIAAGTCWRGDLLGADPQEVRKLSGRYDVPYVVAARALADRPAFETRVGCSEDHAVEVYKVVRLPRLRQRLADYAALLRIQAPLYATVARSVSQACMTDTLAKAARKSDLPGAVMSPVLPSGGSLGWAPAAPDQWAKGQRVFACTLTWKDPEPTRYSTVFTKALPVDRRTCIDSKSLLFVDCARRHDRERISFIEARDAVGAGAFPGPQAIKTGPDGRFLDVGEEQYRKLDAACRTYLRAVSTTKKLTGIANVDADEWPTPDGSYPIYCEADTRPDKKSVVTEGSVYDRG